MVGDPTASTLPTGFRLFSHSSMLLCFGQGLSFRSRLFGSLLLNMCPAHLSELLSYTLDSHPPGFSTAKRLIFYGYTESRGLPSPSLVSENSLVGLGRLELPTSRLSGVRSSHLSYRPTSTPGFGPALCAGGADRGRTGDLLSASQALSQLSYSPKPRPGELPVTLAGDVLQPFLLGSQLSSGLFQRSGWAECCQCSAPQPRAV